MPKEIYEPVTELRSRAKTRTAYRHVSKIDRHKDRDVGRKADNARC